MLFCQPSPLFALCSWLRTRVRKKGDGTNFQIASTRYVHLVRLFEVGTPQVAIECDCAITCWILANLFYRCQVLYSVCKQIWMCVAKDERSKLHDGNEACEVLNLSIWIPSIYDTGEVEELCSLIDFGPKSLLEGLLCRALDGNLFDQVEMCQDTDNLWEPMSLKNVEKLKGFHFKAKAGINHEKNEICNLSNVDHRV